MAIVFSIVHSNRVGNPVFDSTSDWLTVDFGELEVTEYQGSFQLNYAKTKLVANRWLIVF